jgi:hypothetical protein
MMPAAAPITDTKLLITNIIWCSKQAPVVHTQMDQNYKMLSLIIHVG